MNKGLVGFLIGLIAVIGGAFVATILLKNKLIQNKEDEEDDFPEYDPLDDAVDDEEFENFFGEDELPSVEDLVDDVKDKVEDAVEDVAEDIEDAAEEAEEEDQKL